MPKARRIAVADCETDPFSSYLRLAGKFPAPFLWGWYDGKEYRSFKNTSDFVAFIKERDEILYAHNGGKFDWHFLLPHFNVYDEITLINGRIAAARIGRCEIRDSFTLLPVPLSDYKKDEIDYSIFTEELRSIPKNAERIADYLRSDCVYLFELVSAFIEHYGLHLTLASAAMHTWRHMSVRPVPRTNSRFYETFYPYYFGGRVQCFERGIINTDFSVYDINSAYPRAMYEMHPYDVDYSQRNGFVEDADFYRVRCKSDGAFAFRAPELVFPQDGEMREFFATRWELEAAEDTGSLRGAEILESVWFEGKTNFAEYIDRFYQLRLEAKANKDVAMSLFTKLFMNALYGKFAANPENYNEYRIAHYADVVGFDKLGWKFAGEFGPWALASAPLPPERQRYYNVATGASITGYVRAMLWRAIKASEGVLYCDTDSVAVRKAGAIIKCGSALGEWKHEGEFARAGIGGKKLYIFEGARNWWTMPDGATVKAESKPHEKATRLIKAASKGVRLSFTDLWKVARGEMVVYESDVPTFSALHPPLYLSRDIKMTAKPLDKAA